jgi:MerR family transcriptional regulator/heat shock protein HspR
MSEGSHPLFAISVAAELAETTVANLRAYENGGLLIPSRTDGGTRRYSQDDVDRLKRIRVLLDAGLNVAGISRVLELEDDLEDLRSQQDD